MVKDTSDKQSSLDKFRLSFEYDMTWQDVKKSIRIRTNTK